MEENAMKTAATRAVMPRTCSRSTPAAVGAALMLMSMGGAQAVEISSPSPDVSMRWDNTLRYGLGIRAENPDSAIINHPMHSSGDLKFGSRGDIISNRLDLLTEFDFIYKSESGFRVSAAAWGDAAYDDQAKHLPGVASPYFDDRYSSTTKRFTSGPSGELLDAFAFTRVHLGEVPVNVRIGQYTEYWGETLFAPYLGVNYAQAPLDSYKALSSPGSEVKELFLPTAKLSLQAQLLPELSVSFYKAFEYEHDRIPDGGTYFGDTDLTFNGVDRAQLAPGFVVVQARENSGKDHRHWGANARWSPAWLDGTLGFYYRRFDEKIPYGVQFDFPNSRYRLSYGKDVQLYGLSLAKSIGGVSVGAELAYRKNTALLSAANTFADATGARGDVLFGVLNGLWFFSKSPLWNQATLAVETNWTHLVKVNENPELATLVDGPGCGGGSKASGCTHKNAWGANIAFAPSWDQVWPSVDLSMPVSYGIGIRNNGVTPGSTNEGQGSYSIGLSAVVSSKWTFTLKYIDYLVRTRKENGLVTVYNGQGDSLISDRGWVSFTAKTSF